MEMKVGIPLFKERISPHFGTSTRILLIETNGATIYNEAEWDVGAEGPMEFARRIVDLGIDWLICGGIQLRLKDWLTKRGINVMDNQRGKAREVIKKILREGGLMK